MTIKATMIGLACVTYASTAFASERQIGNRFQMRANGCHEEHQPFSVEIPDHAKLDNSYVGTLPGIRVREGGSGKHGSSNWRFTDNGKKLAFQLNATGAGHWIGRWCKDAAGADDFVDIYGVYKPRSPGNISSSGNAQSGRSVKSGK